MTLTAAITKGERLQHNLKGSPIGSMRDLLDFADYDLADMLQAMIEAQDRIYELEARLSAEYPDELRVMVYEHNQAMEARVPA